MGLFSIFKRKNGQPEDTPAERESARARATEAARPIIDNEAERKRQRDIARATAMKIDAIESAMAFDIFNQPEPAWGSGPKKPPRSPNGEEGPSPTLPMMELATTELLHGGDFPDSPVAAQTAPVIEEIAIMFSHGQMGLAESMLVDSLATEGQQDRTVWWMLFDLYQTTGKQDEFDNLAIDYASRFETSPPTWSAGAPAAAQDQAWSGLTPTEAFLGVLDGNITTQLQRLQEMAERNHAFRLEFGRIIDVTPEGCALLLACMHKLRKTDHELIVAGAVDLAEIVRARIEVGRRDAIDAPWLLLLELLQLMDREKDFEETAMDYCVTYEVSPPSFEKPAHVATAASSRDTNAPDRFMLPPTIEGSTVELLNSIDTYAAKYEPVVIDCSRLTRVEFGAANQLLNRLRPLHEAGKKIEFRELNHLVAALFKLLGFAEIARLYPHKY